MPLRKEEIIRTLDVGLIVNKKLNAKIHTALDNNCWICSVRWLSLWARNLSFLDFPGSTTSGLVGKAPGRAPGSWNGGIMEADIPTCGKNLGKARTFFYLGFQRLLLCVNLNLARSFEIMCYEFLNILSNPLVGKSQPLCLQAAVLNRESVRQQGWLSFLSFLF